MFLLFFCKAYFINQDDFPVASEADLAKLDQETAAVRQELQNLNDQVRIMEGKIRALTSELTTADAEKKRDQLKNEIKELEAKLQMLSGQGDFFFYYYQKLFIIIFPIKMDTKQRKLEICAFLFQLSKKYLTK